MCQGLRAELPEYTRTKLRTLHKAFSQHDCTILAIVCSVLRAEFQVECTQYGEISNT